MKSKLLLAAAAALAATTACAPMGEPGATGAMAGDMTPEDRMGFVRMAGASDLFEIQSSQLALSRSQNQAVRQYAQMLITHHTQTTQQVAAAAQASGITPPPPMLLPMQQRMMDQLRAASAGNFDRVYLTQQVPAHEMALALHSNYARSGDTPALRAVAAGAVPIVQQHLDGARRMRAGM
jgi:putative membrane protein